MIKDVFKLKKNSWHMKLMNWMWGYNPSDFPNMCPYFWLSLANLFLAPFKLLGVVLFLPIFFSFLDKIEHIARKYRDNCDEKEKLWLKEVGERIMKNPNDPIVAKIVEAYRKDQRSGTWSMPRKYKYIIFNYHNIIPQEVRDLIDKRYNEIRTNPVKPVTTRSVIAKDTVLVKTMAKIIGIGLGLLSIYGIYHLILWIGTWNWNKIGDISKIVFIILIVAIISAFVLHLVVKFISYLWCKYGEFCIPCSERREKLVYFITYPFKWTWRGLVLLWDILMALKQNNCPGIDWEE